jgi:hypothetical protein
MFGFIISLPAGSTRTVKRSPKGAPAPCNPPAPEAAGAAAPATVPSTVIQPSARAIPGVSRTARSTVSSG